MEPRILNMEVLTSHGNIAGRTAMLQILEAGLQASDPYHNTRELIRIEKNNLIIGGKKFEPQGSPRTGKAIYDLDKLGRIFVFGAGKGIQRVAKAIEEALGDRLTGGHVIDKKGHPVILERIGVTLGGHPVPDDDCVRGCEKILEMSRGLTGKDLVFTCSANGVSSLLTMPAHGISLEDVRKTTYIMQIEHGVPTSDLNTIRNHLDMMKGGRISKYMHPARMVHLIAIDPGDYQQLMYRNLWLHNLPDCTTFQMALDNLRKWDAWEEVPASVRDFLQTACRQYETVKSEEFEKMNFRVFGVMPGKRQTAKFPAAIQKAKELGFRPVILTDDLRFIEARHAGIFYAAIARSIERDGTPFKAPVALFSSGEMVVTVGKEDGIGGRNQEFALAVAQGIAGSKNIVVASVDTDGTDGPGAQFARKGFDIPCLAGGIVDGETVAEAKRAGVDIIEEMKRHNTTPALWKLNSGIVATPNISIIDLTIALVMPGCKEKGEEVF